MSVGSIESSDGTGYGLVIGSNGAAKVAQTGAIDVNGPVEVEGVVGVRSPTGVSVSQGSTPVTTSSAVLVAGNSDRIALQIQNRGTDAVYINLVGATATTDDLKIASGETYQFPCNIVVTGNITAISDGTSDCVVCEFSQT